MSSLTVAAWVFACTFGGAIAGLVLHARLPENHRNDNSKDVVKLVMGLIATIAALVLGLLISSSKSFYDSQKAEVQQLGIHLFQLDRILMRFGPDATEARRQLRQIVSTDIAHTWKAAPGLLPAVDQAISTQAEGAELFDCIARLPATTDAEHLDQGRALQLLTGLWETHRLLNEQSSDSLSWALLIVLVFWLMFLFVGFGIFARCNATVTVALLIGALSVAGAVFLILEMNQPYRGVMQISSAPLRDALPQIGR